MLEPSSRALPSLPSATWLDECLLSARTQNRVVGVRFGRTADPLCMEADEALRDAMDSLKMEELLTMYTVDLDEVTEFTYMYELHDPFSIMLFYRSKPLIFDAGHGETRKLTDLSPYGRPPLATLLYRVVRTALDLETPLESGLNAAAAIAGAGASENACAGAERPDDAATWEEEAQRVARETASWLGVHMAPALVRSNELLQQAEVTGWAALERSRQTAEEYLESAKQLSARQLQKVVDSLGGADSPPPGASSDRERRDAPAAEPRKREKPEPGPAAASSAADPRRKKALCVGIDNYKRRPLRKSVNDARDVAAKLEHMGFDTTLVTDCNSDEFTKKKRAFTDSVQAGDAAVFFFAGHGVEAPVRRLGKWDQSNWLLATDLPEFNDDLPRKAIDAQDILAGLEERSGEGGFNVLILDCCRNDPLDEGPPPLPAEMRGIGGGLNKMLAPSGSMIAFACAPKQQAAEPPTGRNGTFTKHLLKHIETPGLSLHDLFVRVSNAVKSETRDYPAGQQKPYVNHSLTVEGASLCPVGND